MQACSKIPVEQVPVNLRNFCDGSLLSLPTRQYYLVAYRHTSKLWGTNSNFIRVSGKRTSPGDRDCQKSKKVKAPFSTRLYVVNDNHVI